MFRVLLVDDEVFARKGLYNLIDWESCGFEVAGEADNGEDALQLIEKLEPDLVLTDIRMPEVDGLELIRRVMEGDYPKPAFIIISGYNDFRYAQQAVRYGVHDFILKPVDEDDLQSTLRKLNEKLTKEKELKEQQEQYAFSDALSSFIRGDFEEEALVRWSLKLGLQPGSTFYYAFVESNDQISGLEPETSGLEIHHLQQAIRSMYDGVGTVYVQQHRNRLGLIVTDRMLEPFQRQVADFAAALRRKLQHIVQLQILVYVGMPVHQLSQIGAAYQTAKEALQYKFVKDQAHIVLYENVKNEPLHYIDIDSALYLQLIDAIEELDETKMLETVDRLFTEFQTKRFAPEAIKSAVHRNVTGVLKIMKQMNIDEQSLETLEPIISWHDVNVTLGKLKEIFLDFVFESSNVLAKSRKEHIKGGIGKIKEYIEANFQENLSLKTIAAQFYMNPVYLGQLFKKTYGVYFNEFLLQLRIQEAKKLLRQTDLRIYEIADKVGFNNADYFVTQFEKIENVTPTEYRNKLLQ